MAIGCLLFVPAPSFGVFAAFLLAIFVLASGITIVQVVANPLISMLGAPATAPGRLTFAQAFNSLGTTIFPYVGSILILRSLNDRDLGKLTGAALKAYRAQESQAIVSTYLGLASVLLAVAGVVWARRNRLAAQPIARTPIWGAFGLLRHPRFGFGALGIFLYVGAEVAIGSVIVNFLMQPDILGLSAREAGERVPFYWGGAMIGRFIGAIRRVAWHRPVLVYRTDIDDAAAAALLQHLLGGELCTEEGALQIDCQYLVVLILGGVEDRSARFNASVVHHDIQPAKLPYGRHDRPLDIECRSAFVVISHSPGNRSVATAVIRSSRM